MINDPTQNNPESDSTTDITPLKHGWTFVRGFFALVAAALFIYGSYYLWMGLSLRSKCYEAQATTILDLAVDISNPGTHRASLKPIESIACKQYISMDVPLKDGEDLETLLQGLEVTVKVQDAEGKNLMAGAFPDRYSNSFASNRVLIALKTPMSEGEYPLIIDVIKPAPAFEGRPVRFISGYSLCGIEWMGAMFGIGIGCAGMFIGSLIGLSLWLKIRKPRRQTVEETTFVQ